MSNFATKLSKSRVGTVVLALFLIILLAGFAMQDISSYISGNPSGGALVEVGDEEVTDRDVSGALQRRLTDVRQTDPTADYATLAKDFDPLMDVLIQDAAIRAFAADQDMTLSKRLIDAEIAKIPATRGLDGKFSQAAYQDFLAQQKLTDAELRKIASSDLLQRLVLGAGSANARVPVGVATPYASMLLEAREADILLVPTDRFLADVPAPTDADLADLLSHQCPRLHRPRAARARRRADRPGAGRQRRPHRQGNRGLLQRQPGDLRRQRPAA